MSPWGSAEIGHVIIVNSSLGTLVTSQVDYVQLSLALKYTLRKKGCNNPIWGNKIDMDRFFVFPVG